MAVCQARHGSVSWPGPTLSLGVRLGLCAKLNLEASLGIETISGLGISHHCVGTIGHNSLVMSTHWVDGSSTQA